VLVLRAELKSEPALDAASQMALDEAMLDLASPGDVILRVYRWSGLACTFGYARPYAEVRAALDEKGWKDVGPVRRATGGGIVYHDGDLTFSLVFPWDQTLAPDHVYKNIHRGVYLGLKEHGVKSALWSPREKPCGASPSCFARAEPMDLVDESGTKMLGGALRKRAGKGLYQGSLRPERLGVGRATLEAAVRDGAAREFGKAATDIPDAWREEGRRLESRYRSAEWNQRR
jgi:lipoate-protein ligase A